MSDLLNQANALLRWSIQHRRYLHQYPELSLQEKNTAEYCANILSKLGYTINKSWGCGFTADLAINDANKTIALRADMDALPIEEKNTHDFVSKNKGAAHMCGHDSHMTIALTAARLLSENKNHLKTNIRFIFQPSEEKPPGGAIGMIEQGCLEKVDEVYGLHNDPGTPVGKIRTRTGALMAAGDRFDVSIKGRGCHAARPQDGLDPIMAGVHLAENWRSILKKRQDQTIPALLTVTQFHAGDTFNVIPDNASLSGTVRTFSAEDRDLIENSMQQSLTPFNERGYQCELNYVRGYDAVINHQQGVKRIVSAAEKIIGKENVDDNTELAGWAEDFAYYLQHCPGAFYFLGSGNVDKGIIEPLHSARFDIDENALAIGAAIMAQLVLMN